MGYNSNRWILIFPVFLLMLLSEVQAQNRAQNIDVLFDALELQEGAWVADIGSREGFFTVRIAPKVEPGGHVFAVDVNARALEDLHQNLKERNIHNVTPVYSVTDSPMLPAGVLDAVLIRNTYHEFTEPISMLLNIKKALKPNGRLVIAEPISDDLLDASRERQARSHDIAKRYVEDDLAKAGFKILREIEEYSINNSGNRLWLLVAQPK